MNTRVTSAIASRKARENLIRLLFPSAAGTTTSSPSLMQVEDHEYTDRHSHSRQRRRPGDVTPISSSADSGNSTNRQKKRHTYSQLRMAYLQKAHAIHPDKMAAHIKQQTLKTDDGVQNSNSSEKNATENSHLLFIELQNAWEEYHASIRIVQQRRNNNDVSSSKDNRQYSEDEYWEEEDNFTMFGVGCSFADSPAERDLRNEIMEQACRGWFSSGLLSTHAERIKGGGGNNNSLGDDYVKTMPQAEKESVSQPQVKLSDDDMFVRRDDDDQITKKEDCSERKFLVPNVNVGKVRKKR